MIVSRLRAYLRGWVFDKVGESDRCVEQSCESTEGLF